MVITEWLLLYGPSGQSIKFNATTNNYHLSFQRNFTIIEGNFPATISPTFDTFSDHFQSYSNVFFIALPTLTFDTFRLVEFIFCFVFLCFFFLNLFFSVISLWNFWDFLDISRCFPACKSKLSNFSPDGLGRNAAGAIKIRNLSLELSHLF